MLDTAPDARTDEDIALGALTGSLGFLLRLSQLVTYQAFYEAFQGYDVRAGEVSVLTLISENPGIRQGVLARRLMIKPAHMTKQIRALEDAGLVARSVPDDDRRAIELRLTTAGKARMAKIEVPLRAHESRRAPGLTEREEAELKRLLRKYLDLPAPTGNLP